MSDHVWIDAHRHSIIPLDSLENRAYASDLDIEFPEGAGWATVRLGSQRFCAWLKAREDAS